MSYFSKREEGKIKSIVYMLFAFMLLFSIAVFGQTDEGNDKIHSIENNSLSTDKEPVDNVRQEPVSNASNMNFVLWFMGAKQSPNTTVLPVGTTGKQFITSGTVLNRLLFKAFLKKAINFETVVV